MDSTESKRRQVSVTRMAIRWGDMDAMGHVNNTVYFRFMEQARVEWLEQIDALPDPSGTGPVVVNAHCSFMKQLKYPGQIEVRTFVGTIGRASFETIQEIRLLGADGEPGEVIHAEGGAKIVWVDLKREKSVPLPDGVRALLGAVR